ncbi:NUDIX domain-containing protein [Candidatus Woesearchaeota archaeon]|nr:NUDIX domain-containing protein [Candidatus Woesearchaeota archaeon]
MKTYKKVQAVIYDIKDNKLYFLILHRVLRWKGWELLKESLEKGENVKGALLRGIKEETNLKKFKIEKKIKLNKKVIFYNKEKTVKNIILDIFLVRVDMKQKISLHKNAVIEHDKYRWVDRKTAVKMLTFSNTKEVIRTVEV